MIKKVLFHSSHIWYKCQEHSSGGSIKSYLFCIHWISWRPCCTNQQTNEPHHCASCGFIESWKPFRFMIFILLFEWKIFWSTYLNYIQEMATKVKLSHTNNHRYFYCFPRFCLIAYFFAGVSTLVWLYQCMYISQAISNCFILFHTILLIIPL